ncbi:hypothetical protein [Kitasatospora griseola]|uniref:hypothetical protein n=1 Tax=Kitasatospora griseola TaxID=2064 RepID=UPI00128E1AD2|nr:hypothetical protein [Kitasatospora griseola]
MPAPGSGRRWSTVGAERLRARARDGGGIRPLADSRGSLFLYVALDRSRADLALARHSLKRIESAMAIR